MPERTPLAPSERPRHKRRSLFLRLRPFLRQDLRPRLVSAAVAAGLVGGLSWLGVSALTEMDSREARDLRVSLALEAEDEVCDGPGMPTCAFDDRLQDDVDRDYAREQRIRAALMHELGGRIDAAIANLDAAKRILENEAVDLHGDLLGGRKDLADLLLTTVDLRPLTTREEDLDRTNALQRAAYSVTVQNGRIEQGGRDALIREIEIQRSDLELMRTRATRLLDRDADQAIDAAPADRQALWAELFNNDPYGKGGELAGWLLAAGGQTQVSNTLGHLSRLESEALAEAVFNRDADLWHGTFTDVFAEYSPITKASVRYASPVSSDRRWQLFGATLLGLASLFLLVVGPVATATHTAREREAGTLPVLRMTGLSAGDLAMAMALGPNVFASVAGGLLLLAATLALLCTAGPIAVALPLGVLLFSAVATHLAAIGLGDALGHRVNALMVGALTAFGIVVPGVAGAALVTQKVSGAGLLLGPLAPVLAGITGLTGLAPADAMIAYDASFGGAILGYALVVQGLLGAICLLSWRRRVEQAWTPLFRPAEGIALAVASVGCSGLALLDLSERLNTQSFDKLNMVTFLASSFLLPLLGWLLVASLRRPARATAIASHQETRAAFWRFQGVIALTAAIVGIIYHFAMNRSGLGAEPSELMWATLTQVLLIAETALGTLLWASRRREGKARVAMLGGALIVLQTAFAALTYSLEVDFVAIHHQAGAPFLMGMSASPYWIALMIVLWGGGLGLILTALLRDRDRIAAENQAAQEQDESDDEEGHHRWLH